MTINQQIRKALELLAPSAGDRTECERDIKVMLERVGAEMFLDRPSPPPRRDATRNKAAVAAGYHLLEWWGQKAAVTRSGKWAQLAKILAGDQTVDLFDHLREFKRRPTPSTEKVRGAHSIAYVRRRR